MTEEGKCIVVSDPIKFPESYFGLKFDLKYDLSLEYGKQNIALYMGTNLKIKDSGR